MCLGYGSQITTLGREKIKKNRLSISENCIDQETVLFFLPFFNHINLSLGFWLSQRTEILLLDDSITVKHHGNHLRIYINIPFNL